MPPLFDRIMMIDWSAANRPVWGANSIWIADSPYRERAETAIAVANISTRHEAMQMLRAACHEALMRQARLFVGCDFSLGYPAGTAQALTGRPCWQALWAALESGIIDGVDNRSNRFEYAAQLNRRLMTALGIEGPFWGHPPGRSYEGLGPRKPRYRQLAERREVERRVPRAHPNWKLAYTGAVGSQALLGIAHLSRLRSDPALSGHMAIWPFETGFDTDLSKPVIVAETYPALFDIKARKNEVPDAAQVRCVVAALMARNKNGTLGDLFKAPCNPDKPSYKKAVTEEGWILGASCGL